MNADYEVWICTPEGRRLALLDELFAFTASRVQGEIGRFNGIAPATFDPSYVRRDGVIQVNYRGRLWRTYFIRRWRWERREGERVFQFLDCPGCNEILARRIVATYAGSAQSEMTDFADDMMKQVVRNSESDVTLPTPDAGTRDFAQFSVDQDWSLGPTLTLGFAWRQLLTPSGAGVMSSIAKAAREAGTPVFWDVVPIPSANSIDYRFRTYLDQLGADVRDRFTFDEASGSLTDGYYEEDWTLEENYVYGGGKGPGPARTIVQRYNSVRYGASIWGRREGFLDAANTSDDALGDATNAYLQEHDSVIRAGGRPLDTDQIQFGRDWTFGDRVKVRVQKGEGYREFAEFDAVVNVAAIGVQENGDEVREVRFSYES